MVITGEGGAEISDWEIGTFAPRVTNATTTTAVAPSVSSSARGLAISIAAERTLAAETPAQLTVGNSEKVTDARNSQMSTTVVLAQKRVEVGPTGDVTFTFPNPHAQNGIAGTFIIPDAVDTVEKGLPVQIHTESGIETYSMKVSTDSGLVAPKSVRSVSAGYGTVQNMLSEKPFRIAHRGGSFNFPEMSRYAYGQSALLGYNALEFSVARTADGVLFGLHDDTLLRTSGVDALASSLTWSQVQEHLILNKQPYMKFQDLLSLYPNHVVFVDPKAIPPSLHGEIFDMMDASGGPSRFVFKYYGTTNYYMQAHERGYLAWGYFYETNVPTLDRWQAGWDLLGMEYSASQSSWDVITSFGKPVVGHICPNRAAADAALSKGASGLMVSGVKSVG